MPYIHRLAIRQLKRCGLPEFEELSPEWQEFVQKVSASYNEAEENNQRLSQSLEKSSVEMTQLYDDLADQNNKLEQKIHERTQELEKAKDAAELLAEYRSQFLANMSHEIRTPMHGILMAANMLHDEVLDPKNMELVSVIQRSSTALLQILNDILDLSKLSQGKLNIEAIPFRIPTFIADIHALFDVHSREKGLDFEVLEASKIPEFVIGDSYRLRQIVINLLGNAFKFTALGRVCLSLSYDWSLHRLHVEVQDTGIGIPPDKLDHIFEEFSQVDDSTTRKFGGTGLGLSISKRLVDLMNGRLWVTSIENEGSSFCFDLPLEVTDHSHATIQAVMPQWKKTPHVLLVDDNHINRKLARKMLEKLNVNIHEAENGQQAWGMALGGLFDIILMDIQMPIMGGEEATVRIRKEISSEILPIIALTANAFKEQQDIYQSLGMNECLAKPFTQDKIVDVLNRNLKRSLFE